MHFVMTEHVDPYIEAVPAYVQNGLFYYSTTGNPASIQFVVLYKSKE